MCTAIFYKGGDSYFGRTLDLEYSFDEEVVIAPKNFVFDFRHCGKCESHYAIIGIATVSDGYPLYYDAANEAGLAIAGLNFPKSAYFPPVCEGKTNLAPFELIPYILGKYKSVDDVKAALENINIASTDFSEKFKAAPLHFMIADKERSIVLESRRDGLHIFENNVGVLTNEPPFESQTAYLSTFVNLSATEPCGENLISRGLGAIGLPGDFSSMSRFVRTAFILRNIDKGENDILQFFRTLGSVEVPKGAVCLENGKRVITHYTTCFNLLKGICYYKTYNGFRIKSVDMRRENLDGDTLVRYPLNKYEDILLQN